MKNAYPVIMEKDGDGFVVSIPDFRLDTQGDSIQDAIEMARDAIGIAGVVLEDKGVKLPEASGYEEALGKAPEGAIVSFVDIDFAEYRRKSEMRVVRKNCTVPSWLCHEAEEAGINFSAILQAGLKRELHIED